MKAKCLLAELLILCLLIPSFALAYEGGDTAIYTARSASDVKLLAKPEEGADMLIRIPKGKRFNVFWLDPTWLECEYEGYRGYLKRSSVEAVKVIDMENTPPYGVMVHTCIAEINGQADVMSEKGGGDTLITLYDGARVAFIGFEDGYAKLIFKRQYGYIDSNCLRDVCPVDRNLEDPGTEYPVAAYVSFYSIADTEANIGRMENIRVACRKLGEYVFNTGERLDFNAQIGPYKKSNGYYPAPVLVNGSTQLGYGGGTCQVSSTLYNTVLQLPGITIVKRRAHGPSGASYLPHGVDAAVGNSSLNFIIRNDYTYPIRIDASAQDGALYISVYRVSE